MSAETRRTASEEWLERYCAEHGVDVLAYEPDLGVATRPDFLVAKDGMEVVCEVKEFTDTRFDRMWRSRSRLFSLSERRIHTPVRNQVREAARNLRPLADSQWPLVVVLANPQHVHVELEPDRLIHALYGDLTVTFPVDPEGPASEPEWFAGRNGRLRNNHAYISAVVALREGDHEDDWWREWHERQPSFAEAKDEDDLAERFVEREAAAARAREEGEIPNGNYYRVDAILTASETATPLPADFFNGARDTVWAFDGERSFAKVG